MNWFYDDEYKCEDVNFAPIASIHIQYKSWSALIKRNRS